MIKANTFLDVRKFLAPDGPISQSLEGFELRHEQIEMASAVQQALHNGRHLVVEAGTGVGKSFAYLVPAIELVAGNQAKIVVSTYTITLQEQLIRKDVPFLAALMPRQFTAVLAKGRGNYLCKRRLNFALRMQKNLFDNTAAELEKIKAWADTTSDGSLSDMHYQPAHAAWDKVNSEHGNCRGRRCPHFGDCFYRRARRRLESADIIVVNHALLFSDLALKKNNVSLLPDYRFVIIDEAHNIEHVAEDHFGINITNRRVSYILDSLYNTRTHKGLLAYINAHDVIETVRHTAAKARTFFKTIHTWYEQTRDENNGRCYKNFVEDPLSGYFNNLKAELATIAKQTEDADQKFEIQRFVHLCDDLVADLKDFLTQEKPDYVYWVEAAGQKTKTVRLRSAAVNVGADVKACLFDKYQSVIMTSATLSTEAHPEKHGFDFFTGRIGLDDFDALKLGSSFDYEKQVTIYIEKNLPQPNDKAFIDAAVSKLKTYLHKTSARAFVLFTSYAMLQQTAEKLSDWLAENNIELLQQGSTIDRTRLLARFKAGRKSVLFGTDSFWQGVDVPGQALSNVIIVRLPFAVPDQPLLAGRLEQIRDQGGNPFFDYQLPSAVIKFKQGFGRLIRSKTDTGIVVILDSRILTKPYGQKFLNALPKCKTIIAESSE